jgi:hypothetical protein
VVLTVDTIRYRRAALDLLLGNSIVVPTIGQSPVPESVPLRARLRIEFYSVVLSQLSSGSFEKETAQFKRHFQPVLDTGLTFTLGPI